VITHALLLGFQKKTEKYIPKISAVFDNWWSILPLRVKNSRITPE